MSDKKIEYPELYAIWRHSQYPYFLIGKITKFKTSGFIETVEFGPGNSFWPVAIVPKEFATLLKEKLEDLQEEKETAFDLLKEEWDAKLDNFLCENECPIRASE